MNDMQLVNYQPALFPNLGVTAEDTLLVSFIKQVRDSALSLSIGALGGYTVYLITHLIDKSHLLNTQLGFQKRTCVLNGVATFAVLETAFLAYAGFFKVLGERATYENLVLMPDTSGLNRMRHRVWTFVRKGEQNCQAIAAHCQTIANHPVCHRITKIASTVILNGIGGFLLYAGTALMGRLRQSPETKNMSALPYVLAGLASGVITETAHLVYDVGVYLLGDRQLYERLDPTQSHSLASKLRQHSWKVASCFERIPRNIDVIFSRTLGIHTAVQIHNQNIPERDRHLFENIRTAFIKQVGESLPMCASQELGVYAVEAAGYTVLGGHLLPLHTLFFILGLFTKTTEIYERNHVLDVLEAFAATNTRSRHVMRITAPVTSAT